MGIDKLNQTNLSQFENNEFDRGASKLKELAWMICSAMFFKHSLAILNGLKRQLLILFGAKVGKGVLIKPNVTIKFPWKLELGNFVWIGENVWIDNLATVTIADNVCLSQGAMLLTGNHNYKKTTFDLMTGAIHLEEGVWIGAQAVVCPGVKCGSHAVLGVNSTATKDLLPYSIYRGNPASKFRERAIS